MIFAISIAIIVTTLKIANVNTIIFAIFTIAPHIEIAFHPLSG